MTLEKYAQEVFDYMVNKLPDVNHATLYETTEFFVLKTNNYTQDALNKNNEQWLENIKRQDEWYLKLMKVK